MTVATKIPALPNVSDNPSPFEIAAFLRSVKTALEVRDGITDPAAGGRFITLTEFEAPAVWTDPTLRNSWRSYAEVYGPSGYNNAGYTKDKAGVVRLRGLLVPGATGTTGFQLPPGYRPINRQLHLVANEISCARVDITAEGDVVLIYPASTWISLDCIAFLPA